MCVLNYGSIPDLCVPQCESLSVCSNEECIVCLTGHSIVRECQSLCVCVSVENIIMSAMGVSESVCIICPQW